MFLSGPSFSQLTKQADLLGFHFQHEKATSAFKHGLGFIEMCSRVQDSTNASIFSYLQIIFGYKVPSSPHSTRKMSEKWTMRKHATCPLLLTISEWAVHTEDLWELHYYKRKTAGLSWLEIDQVTQIPPWREAKRIGFNTERKTVQRQSLPVDFILAIGAEKQTAQTFISSTGSGQSLEVISSALQLHNS